MFSKWMQETVHSRKDPTKIKKFHLKETNPRILAVGNAIGSGIGTGRSHTIKSIQQMQEFKKGEILVTTMTDPDWEPILSIASAIVTNEGGRTCHAAIISRELGIPCVVGKQCLRRGTHRSFWLFILNASHWKIRLQKCH